MIKAQRVLALFLLLIAKISLSQGSGNCVSFSGSSNSYVALSSVYSNLTIPATISYWLEKDGNANSVIVSTNTSPTSYSGIWTQIFSNYRHTTGIGTGGGFSSNNRRSKRTNSNYNFQEWVHYAIVYHSLTNIDIYINGNLIASSTSGTGGAQFNSATGVGYLGKGYLNLNTYYPFKGLLDGFQIWDKALTANEVRAIMCRPPNLNDSLLLGYYDFDNVIGGIVPDSSLYNTNVTGVNILTPISGAAIGDSSQFHYPSGAYTSSSFSLSNGISLNLQKLSGPMNGAQIYEIFSSPNSSSGLPTGLVGNDYFGVFAAKNDVANASFSLEILGIDSTSVVYGRERNDNSTWSIIPSTPISNGRFISSITNRTEIMVETIPCSVSLPDTIHCPSPSSYIKAYPYYPSVTYTWNGSTIADSILVGNTSGWVVVEADSLGCISTDSTFIKRTFTGDLLGVDTLFCPLPSSYIKPNPFYTSVSYTWNGSTIADSIQVGNASGWISLVADSAGCFAEDSLFISRNVSPRVFTNDTTLCLPDSLVLSPPANITLLWPNGSTSQSFWVDTPGTIIFQSIGDCQDTLSHSIQVNDISLSSPVIPTEIVKCENSIENFDLSLQDYTVVWDDSTFSGLVQNQDSLSGNLISICGDSIQFSIDVVNFDCANCRLYIPNTFTPNGDGVNDEFFIGISCETQEFSISIFSRWGNLVFSSQDVNFSWGAIDPVETPAGVYPYIIKYVTLNGKKYSETGFITIFK